MDFKSKIEEMSVDEVKKQQEGILTLELPPIVSLHYKGDDTKVEYFYPELEGICPMTGLPDNYVLKITYLPHRNIPELKSLRFYLIAYRDIPILHENLINKIFHDFDIVVQPTELHIEIKVAIRGGISTTLVKEK